MTPVRALVKLRSGIVRRPPELLTAVPRRAEPTADRSAAGSAWHAEPPMVRGCARSGRR
jgi:hypothetical protein